MHPTISSIRKRFFAGFGSQMKAKARARAKGRAKGKAKARARAIRGAAVLAAAKGQERAKERAKVRAKERAKERAKTSDYSHVSVAAICAGDLEYPQLRTCASSVVNVARATELLSVVRFLPETLPPDRRSSQPGANSRPSTTQ